MGTPVEHYTDLFKFLKMNKENDIIRYLNIAVGHSVVTRCYISTLTIVYYISLIADY